MHARRLGPEQTLMAEPVGTQRLGGARARQLGPGDDGPGGVGVTKLPAVDADALACVPGRFRGEETKAPGGGSDRPGSQHAEQQPWDLPVSSVGRTRATQVREGTGPALGASERDQGLRRHPGLRPWRTRS